MTLLEEAIHVLRLQCGPEDVHDFITRQVHERVSWCDLTEPVRNWTRIRLVEALVQVVDEHWTLDQLSSTRQWHLRDKPKYQQWPLVIFRGWNRLELVDGQTRVNRWRADGNEGPHRVLFVQPQKDLPDPFLAAFRPK